MSEEIKEITTQLKEILNKYPNRQLEILLYVFGRDNLMEVINEPTYEELEQENRQLKRNCNIGYEELNFYREAYEKYKSVLDEIREYIDGVITIWKTNPSAIATLDLEYLLQQIDKVKE